MTCYPNIATKAYQDSAVGGRSVLSRTLRGGPGQTWRFRVLGRFGGSLSKTGTPMGFTFGRRRADADQDSREIPAPDKALSKILGEIRDITSDRRTTPDQRSRTDRRTDTALSDTPRGARPSLDSTARLGNLKEDQFRGVRPSFARRASRALTRFLIAAFISVGSILVWQSYGDATKENVASWAPQLGWVRLLPTLKPPPDIAPVAPAARFPDVEQQLEAVVRDLAALRQSVDRLAVGQEQMARNLASLETAENDIRSKISAPKPAAAPPRSPALKYPQPVTEILAPRASAPPPTDLKPRTTN
jgi:hypothetical protein